MGARGWRRVHGWATVAFLGLWAAAIMTGWIDSVEFVSHMSMLALVYTGICAWQAGRTEVKVDEDGS